MAKAFRKLEVILNGTVYTLNRAASEMLLARMDAFGEVCSEACRRMREDMRAALATETDTPEPAQADEALVEESVTVNLLVKVIVPADPAPESHDETVCFLCDMPGEVMHGGVTCVCKNPHCPRCNVPLPRNTFEGRSKFENQPARKTPVEPAGTPAPEATP